ncbi:amidase [Paenibacillaceae bacterium]|nr:amidase [Paenibacillaceae bacterium]
MNLLLRKQVPFMKTFAASFLVLSLLFSALTAASPTASAAASFKLQETTISDVHTAMEKGTLSCRALVEQYLAQIKSYDKTGPAINAIITTNSQALVTADILDKQFKKDGLTGPLHCVPVIVKDNYNTVDMPTTGGSLSLQGFMPYKDAFTVARLRDAGAIILAKSNLSEFANGTTTFSSLGGQTLNPYDLTRVPSGSSGGTGASIAANMGLIGLGTETGRSVRGPAAYNSLVGLVPTDGLISREGILPLSDSRDRSGPITRTVADAAKVLDVMVGYDSEDPITVESYGQIPDTYTAFLKKDGLKGARIGVLRQGFDPKTLGTADTTNPEILALIETAVADLKKQGAIIVDPVGSTVNLNDYLALPGVPGEQKTGVDDFLKKYGKFAPTKTFKDIAYSGQIEPGLVEGFQKRSAEPGVDKESAAYMQGLLNKKSIRNALTKIMVENKLDALVYPYNIDIPQKIGTVMDAGNRFSPNSGLPAIVVPAGFTSDGLPASLEFLGSAFSEGKLIQFAYAYEQATLHRRPPATTPVKP